jgi:hypothetical protein
MIQNDLLPLETPHPNPLPRREREPEFEPLTVTLPKKTVTLPGRRRN